MIYDQPVQGATSCAPQVCVWRRADAATVWTTARMRVMKFSAVSHTTSSVKLFVLKLKSQKWLYVFTARPAKNCGGKSPLHPLFVCNGETDCSNGRDEINCTQGTSFHCFLVSKCNIIYIHIHPVRKKTYSSFVLCFVRNNLLCHTVSVQQWHLHPQEECKM